MTAIPTSPRAATLRRDLGPVAWCALECLVERSDDGRTTAASVRAVAAELGVAKNTAHRALAVLVRAGIAEAVQGRTTDGRFRRGGYRLHLGDLVPNPPAPPTRIRTRTPSATRDQLSLLPSA
ncbi:MAG TPA: helix-turn-helix domain-containing protein [Acidimicrobiales bacterium]|nr:helix-turn-helix domain-containing protein [Acidimicrobiales bacterium]